MPLLTLFIHSPMILWNRLQHRCNSCNTNIESRQYQYQYLYQYKYQYVLQWFLQQSCNTNIGRETESRQPHWTRFASDLHLVTQPTDHTSHRCKNNIITKFKSFNLDIKYKHKYIKKKEFNLFRSWQAWERFVRTMSTWQIYQAGD